MTRAAAKHTFQSRHGEITYINDDDVTFKLRDVDYGITEVFEKYTRRQQEVGSQFQFFGIGMGRNKGTLLATAKIHTIFGISKHFANVSKMHRAFPYQPFTGTQTAMFCIDMPRITTGEQMMEQLSSVPGITVPGAIRLIEEEVWLSLQLQLENKTLRSG